MTKANMFIGLSSLDKVTPVKSCDAMHRKASLNNTLKVLIAFALVERSESDDISPTSSRSSKRSFDRQVDYLDLLRIHSVVQAFFIDSLHEQHQISFWLERAVAVWAKSYDEADRRIQEDPRVGLPDDYRRFSIHGEKLLQNLKRFERRYTKLAVAKSYLEERLEKIQSQIDDLSQAIQKNIVDGSAEEYPASVFDRLSASSQSDAATMQSHGSQLSRMGSFGDENSELVQSPMAELLEHEAQIGAPYPTTPMMPTAPEMLDDDDNETVVLSVAGTQVHVGATDIVEVISLPPDPYDRYQETIAYDDWHDAIPHHRVIKRQETRRYYDRAGSWRDKTISDPRVGLSWEVAVGSISSKPDASSSPPGAHLTAQSEAEMQLNKIKRAAPPSPKPRPGSFGSQTLARPMTLLGRNSWAIPQVVKTPETEVAEIPPEDFSSGLTQILSSPKSWTSATIKMLKKTVLPSDKPTGAPSQAQPPPDDDLMVPPGPIFRGNRSANSSPGTNASPFPPPTFSGIPTDDLLVRPGGPLVVRRWDTVVYQADGTPVSSSGVEWSSPSDPLSLSYPLLPGRHQHHPSSMHPAQFMLRGGPAAGYSSQPMSRDGSNRSNQSTHVNSPVVIHSPPSRPPSPDTMPRDSPPGMGAVGLGVETPPTTANFNPNPSHHLTPFPFTRARPPSYTETEPSPRGRETPFSDIDTSYNRWQQHPHHTHHTHHHLGGPATSSFPPPSGNSNFNLHDNNSSNNNNRWRPTRGTRILRGGGHNNNKNKLKAKGKRAHSLSPSASPHSSAAGRGAGPGSGSGSGSGSVSPVPWPGAMSPASRGLAVAGVGGGVGGLGGHNGGQGPVHPLAEWSVPLDGGGNGGGGGGLVAGGEPMSRSGSGGSGSNGGGVAAGIRMGDGTVVEFGSPEIGFGFESGTGGVGRGGGPKRGRRGSFPGMGTNGFVVRE
jgi:hypothetical protein